MNESTGTMWLLSKGGHINGLIQYLQDDDPSITAIKVDGWHDTVIDDNEEGIDWSVVGECLGDSHHLKHLELKLTGHDSPDRMIIPLCRGVARNRSIESLRIVCGNLSVDDYEDILLSVASALFGALLPLFEYNVNLEYLSIEYTFQSILSIAALHDAILRAQSLKIFELHSCIDEDDDYDHEDLRNLICEHDHFYTLIKVLCNKPGLQHLKLKRCSLTTNACTELKSALSKKTCTIKSLAFLDLKFDNDAQCKELGHGLKSNGSVRTLILVCSSASDLEIFLGSLGAASANSIEELSINFNFLDRYTTMRYLPAVLKTLHVLKHLDMQSLKLDVQSLKEVFSNLSPSLQSLNIMRGFNDDGLNELASYVSINKSLKTLSFFLDKGSADGMVAFLNTIKQNTTLTQLKLCSFHHFRSAPMQSLAEYVSSNQSLKSLEVWCCAQCGTFERALESHNGLDKLNILGSHQLNFSMDFSKLKKVSLFLTNPTRISKMNFWWQIGALTSVLRDPNCVLEELRLDCTSDRSPTDTYAEKYASKQLFLALRKNKSLKILRYSGIIASFFVEEDVLLPIFYELLGCGLGDIDATYHSNHTLEVVQTSIPLDAFAYLRMNKNPNKFDVARNKILRFCDLEGVSFGYSELPHALSWMGNASSYAKLGLSELFKVLRRNCHVIPKIQRKRKRQ